jgi:TonB-linked SusC/RagA family outer membrane protein
MQRWLATVGLLALVLPDARAAAQADAGRITGIVSTAEGGPPVAGARITLLGTRVTAETNAQGRYSLSAAPGTYRLRASAIGYAPVIMDSVPVTAGKATTADFQLKHQTVELEKVIVVGYGTQAKRDVTGSVGSVSAEQIQQIPTTNAVEAIKGRIPGVDIVSSGYKPGDDVRIQIRGQRSVKASNDPLFVLDGVPMSGGIGDVNPGDIESIEVLKDASATAIYGSRGANGVVLVTTRRGSAGRTRVTYDTYVAAQSATKKIDVFDAAAYAEYKREAYRAVTDAKGVPLYNSALCTGGAVSCPAADAATAGLFYPQEIAALNAGISTDWQDLIRRQGSQLSHQLSIAGGSDRTQFSVSGNLTRQTGIVLGQDFDRKSMRVNFETQAMPRLRTGASALLLRSTQNQGRGDGVYGEALADSPLSAAFDSTGAVVFKPTPDPQRVNPLSDIANHINELVRTRIFGTLFASMNLADGLDYRINFGPDLTYARQGVFHGAETASRGGSPADAQINNRHTFDYTLDNLLTYRRGFGADHRVDATFLYSIEKQTFEGDSLRASGLPYESQRFYNLGSGGTVEAIGSEISQWALQSYMARLNYTFRDRYLLTLTSRLDGSSRLAPGRKYALFPSVAFAWRAVDESFGNSLGPVNSLKLRTSYGRTGNTSVDPYQTQGSLTRSIYAFGTSPGYGYRPGSLPNPDLRWEKTDQFDAGADFGLYKNRISGTLDYYRAHTSDLLLDRQIPTNTGYNSVVQNIGNTRNTGIELGLTAVALDGWHGVRWTNDLTFARNKNEIIDVGQFDSTGAPLNDTGNRWFIGQPINTTQFSNGQPTNCTINCVWYDYRMIGIWQADEAAAAAVFGEVPGQIKLQDVNGDGKITEADRVILGNTYPKWTGSVNSRVDWQRFDFAVQVVTRQGFMVQNLFRTDNSTLAGRYNGLAVNYWTPTNPSNTEPRPNKNQEFPLYGGTRAYEDASYVRVRNITLGVTVPAELVQRTGAQSLRIYGTAQNPFTFTSFTGLDPEGRASAGTPSYRALLVGANFGF